MEMITVRAMMRVPEGTKKALDDEYADVFEEELKSYLKAWFISAVDVHPTSVAITVRADI